MKKCIYVIWCVLFYTMAMTLGCSDDTKLITTDISEKASKGDEAANDSEKEDEQSIESNESDSPEVPGCVPSECKGTCCGDTCRDTTNNIKHCGACNHACKTDETCVDGICHNEKDNQCTSGERFCGDGCVKVVDDPNNCGDCGKVCEEGQKCSGLSCVLDCGDRLHECDKGECNDILTDPNHCGGCGNACQENELCSNSHCTDQCTEEGYVVCKHVCFDAQSDPDHCGDCDTVCANDEVCLGGECKKECEDSAQIVCNRTCIDPMTDPDFCGTCDTQCTNTQRCDNGECSDSCSDGNQIVCDHECIDPKTNHDHCSACNDSCEPSKMCKDGSCIDSCEDEGKIICNHTCVDITSDKLNCGICGNVCDEKHICTDGTCVCPDDDASCDDPLPECESPNTICGHSCVDLTSNAKHCGKCKNDCGENNVCADRTCVDCEGKTTCGDGICYDLSTDSKNCGACGVSCPAHVECKDGSCSSCEKFYVDCDGDPDNGCETTEASCPCTEGNTRQCYYGPAGTQGIGACKAGTQTCKKTDNGQSTYWSDCIGMVLPQTDYKCRKSEKDSTQNDLNCDGKVDGMEDYDKDGVSICDGDCCDILGQCSVEKPELVAPGLYEIVGNKIDDNCNGQIDENPVTTCTASYSQSTDLSKPANRNAAGLALAKAMDICDMANTKGYGLISATVQSLNPSTPGNKAMGSAINVFHHLTSNGTTPLIKPKGGNSFAGIASGSFRDRYVGGSFIAGGNVPAKYLSVHDQLQSASGCPSGGKKINDTVNLHLELKAPKNATGFKFDFRFYSHEYPTWICSAYNDFFMALLSSKAAGIPKDGNIVFDKVGNPVSINNAFFTSCTPISCTSSCPKVYKTCKNKQCQTDYGACPDGTADLSAFGGGGGATAWLTTKAPVIGGETFTLDFYIWDTSDSILDSAAIIDNFQWLATGGTVAVETGFTDPRI